MQLLLKLILGNTSIITTGLNSRHPIGIFDSGIGGLTVANAIQRLLPSEDIVYFGDTAHLPYGDKSSGAIRQYSLKIADFLLEKKCKILLIACNTASSVAYSSVKKLVGKQALVVNVIDPVVDYVAQHYPTGHIGVIGTKGTINSRIYIRKLNRILPELKVASMATPLLAPMIEEGFFNNYISTTVIHSYLSKKSFTDIEALILGCTHYPLIKEEVKRFYGKKTEIIDSAEIVALKVKQRLSKQNLLKNSTIPGKHRFFVSDFTKSFEESTRYFFKGGISLKKARIWE